MINIYCRNNKINSLSGKIRVDEILSHLDNKTKKEINIYVKPVATNVSNIKDGSYIDVLDGGRFLIRLKYRPKINLIASSEYTYNLLKNKYPNKVVLIPHQHLNWERTRNTGNKEIVFGYTGSYSKIADKIYSKIKQGMNKAGLTFYTCFNFKTREDSVNFYKHIDVLVIGAWELGDIHPYKLPTKIINAASFGIPTIAYPLKGYQEVEGYYLHAENMNELIEQANKLKSKNYYKQWPEKLIKMAEPYHIENIIKLYRRLI
jgi:hypothetical protein